MRPSSVRLKAVAVLISYSGIAAAQSAPITVVDAASYRTTLAPDGLATIFGANLAQSTATASLDANGNLPLELASTRVEVNGQAASLFYVSPSQINFVVPSGIGAGSTTLTVRYANSQSTRNASVPIALAAPALFTADASGSGPGAILNAVTYALAPFLVDTPQNGSDSRTRLALYGTGIRHAAKVKVRGGQQDLVVEYAGAAPGFFGLDQINVVLPAVVDGAGAVSLVVTADDNSSNTVTAQVNLMLVSQLRLAGIVLNPAFVSGGDSMTATVSLNGVARTGGFLVTLGSTNVAAQPQAQIAIAQGSTSIDTTVTTTTVASVQTGSIRASALGVTVAADFEVDPASQSQLSALSISPGSILGGRSLTGTLTLTAPAPAAGLTVQLASDNDAVRVPGAITIPFNQASGTFAITSVAVGAEVNATVTASQGHKTATAQLKLLPPFSFTVDNASVTGGATITGTVTLGDAAPAGGAIINFSSSNLNIVRPGSLTISAGLTSGTVTITTAAVTSSLTAVITAGYQGNTQSVSVTVNPPAPITLQTLVVAPATTAGGQTVQGTVTLTGPAGFGGQRVDLQSSSLLTAQVPGFIVIPQGSTTGLFTITTLRVTTAQTITITASIGAVSKQAVLTVQ